MTDVTIPADVAKVAAQILRGEIDPANFPRSRYEWADLLDPKPPTLRDLIVRHAQHPLTPREADALLAFVADWLAAQPLAPIPAVTIEQQRDHDVRLLQGES